MTKTYAYIVRTDNGGAPCAPDDLLTLGICRPDIRSRAEPGDRLIGISAKRMVDTPNGRDYPATAVIYAAIIDQKFSWADYSSPEYEHRKDCIYAYAESGGNPYRKEDATVHFEDGDLEHDMQSDVLLCRDFRYFGKNAIKLSTIAPRLEQYVQKNKIRRNYMGFDTEKASKKEDLFECDDVFETLWRLPTSYTLPVGGGGNNSQTEDHSAPASSNDDHYGRNDFDDYEEDDAIPEIRQTCQRKRKRTSKATTSGAAAKRSC